MVKMKKEKDPGVGSLVTKCGDYVLPIYVGIIS